MPYHMPSIHSSILQSFPFDRFRTKKKQRLTYIDTNTLINNQNRQMMQATIPSQTHGTQQHNNLNNDHRTSTTPLLPPTINRCNLLSERVLVKQQQTQSPGGAKRFFVSRVHPQQLLLSSQQQQQQQANWPPPPPPIVHHHHDAPAHQQETKNKQNGGGDDIDGKSETAAEREEELISFRYTWPVRITERRIGPDEFAILNVSPPFCTAHNGVQFTWLLRICEENIIDIGPSGENTLCPTNGNNSKMRTDDDAIVDYIDDDLVEFGGPGQMMKKKVNITLYYKEGPARDVKLHSGNISIRNANGMLFDQMPLRELEYTKGGGWSPICAASLSSLISAEQRKFSEFVHDHVGRQITVRVKLEMPASLFQPMQYLPSIDSPISGKLEGLCATVLDEIRTNKLPVPDVQYFDPDTDKYALYRHVYQFACQEICRRFIEKNNNAPQLEQTAFGVDVHQPQSELMQKICNIFAHYYFNTVIVQEAECFEDFLEALDASRYVQFPALRRECERYICTVVMAESADLALAKKMLLLAERFNLRVLKMVSFGVIVDRLLQLPQQQQQQQQPEAITTTRTDARKSTTTTVQMQQQQSNHKISTASSENGGGSSDSGAISSSGGSGGGCGDHFDDDVQQQLRKNNNNNNKTPHHQHMLQRSADSGMTMESSMEEIREELLEIAEQIINPIEHHPSTSSSSISNSHHHHNHNHPFQLRTRAAAPIAGQSNRQHSKSLCSPKRLSTSSGSSGSSADEENESSSEEEEEEDEEAESDPGGETLVGSVITQLEELARHIRKVSMPPGVRPAPAQNDAMPPELVQHSPISTDSGNGSSSSGAVDSRRSSLKTTRETLLLQHRPGRSNSGSVATTSANISGNSFFSQLYAAASSSNESVQRQQRSEQRCNSDTWTSHLHSNSGSNANTSSNNRKNVQFARQMLLEEEEQCQNQSSSTNVTVIHFHPNAQKVTNSGGGGGNRRNVALVQKACSKLFGRQQQQQQKSRGGHCRPSLSPPPRNQQNNEDEDEELTGE